MSNTDLRFTITETREHDIDRTILSSYVLDSAPLVIYIDRHISAPLSGNKPFTDQLLRTIMYLSNRDAGNLPKREFPITFPSKIGGSSTESHAISFEFTRRAGTVSLDIGGRNVGQMPPVGVVGEDFTHICNISSFSIRDFLKMGTAGSGIMGVVPSLGDIPEIWYIRSITAGRLIFLL
jgi:hypothetical protein